MRPTIRLMTISILTFTIMALSYLLIDKGLSNYYVHSYAKLQEATAGENQYDMVYFGSSRVHNSLNPLFIDSILDMNSYNFGIGGANLVEFKLMIESYLSNHESPKFIILGLDYRSFELHRDFSSPIIYFPFLSDKAVYRNFSEYSDWAWWYKNLPFSRIFEFDDYTRGNSVKGLLGLSTDIPVHQKEYNGFLTNFQTSIEEDAIAEFNIRTSVKGRAVSNLKEIVKLANSSGSKLILLYAPEYKQRFQEGCENSNVVLEYIDHFSIENQLKYWRDDTIGLCDEHFLFKDVGHLNERGAEEYSIFFAERIKKEFVVVKNEK